MEYFSLFDIPVSFIVNETLLKKKFYQLSKQFHPDFFTGASANEQANALEKAALINKAYKTLSNTNATMQYILQEKGLLEDEGKASLPNDFLMDMMELNEAVMDAKLEGNKERLTVIENEIKQLENNLYDTVKHLVETYTETTATQETLLPIKAYYLQKKYLSRILEGLQL